MRRENLIYQFIDSLTSRQYSKSTIQGYNFALGSLVEFCETKNIEITNLSDQLMSEFIEFLKQKNHSIRTVNLKISVIKTFLLFLKEKKKLIQYQNSLQFVKIQKERILYAFRIKILIT